MAKPNGPRDAALETELELKASIATALGSLFEPGESIAIRTHNGATFDGVIEDANLVGILLRTTDDRVFFVSYAGIESAELFEAEGDDDGDGERENESEAPVEGDATTPDAGGDEGADVTPITTRAA